MMWNKERGGKISIELVCIVLAVIFLLFRQFVMAPVIVSGESMKITLQDGDVLWQRKFNTEEVNRFDIVIAQVDGAKVIKRIIGLPGEEVRICGGNIYINGEKLYESFSVGNTMVSGGEQTVMLGDGEVYLLGDNREHSRDSRDYGAVKTDQICGVVFMRIFPFWEIENYCPE